MTWTTTLTDGRTKEYYSVAETAALVRKALAKNFPGVKFYVRSKTYSGGGSVDVHYDGLDHYKPLESCHCAEGPLLRNEWGGNQCGRCAYMQPLEPIYKPGMPTSEAVRAITERFGGRGFDGMIDLAYPIDAYMEDDGTVTGNRSHGSGAFNAAFDDAPSSGRLVSFGANYVFVHTELPYDLRLKSA